MCLSGQLGNKCSLKSWHGGMLAVTYSVLSTSKQTACSTDAVCKGVCVTACMSNLALDDMASRSPVLCARHAKPPQMPLYWTLQE